MYSLMYFLNGAYYLPGTLLGAGSTIVDQQTLHGGLDKGQKHNQWGAGSRSSWGAARKLGEEGPLGDSTCTEIPEEGSL